MNIMASDRSIEKHVFPISLKCRKAGLTRMRIGGSLCGEKFEIETTRIAYALEKARLHIHECSLYEMTT